MTPAKVIVSFVGRIERGTFVTLLNEATRERLEAQMLPQVMTQSWLSDGDEFRCVVEKNGTDPAVARVTKLEPKPISKEKLQALREEFEGRWTF